MTLMYHFSSGRLCPTARMHPPAGGSQLSKENTTKAPSDGDKERSAGASAGVGATLEVLVITRVVPIMSKLLLQQLARVVVPVPVVVSPLKVWIQVIFACLGTLSLSESGRARIWIERAKARTLTRILALLFRFTSVCIAFASLIARSSPRWREVHCLRARDTWYVSTLCRIASRSVARG